jgi:hypothetical protein
MFRSAYRLWKSRYPQGGVRFIIFITMEFTISLAALGFGLAYITGVIGNAAHGTKSYRSAGVGFCIAAIVSLLSFLLAVRWYANQDQSEKEVKAP